MRFTGRQSYLRTAYPTAAVGNPVCAVGYQCWGNFRPWKPLRSSCGRCPAVCAFPSCTDGVCTLPILQSLPTIAVAYSLYVCSFYRNRKAIRKTLYLLRGIHAPHVYPFPSSASGDASSTVSLKNVTWPWSTVHALLQCEQCWTTCTIMRRVEILRLQRHSVDSLTPVFTHCRVYFAAIRSHWLPFCD